MTSATSGFDGRDNRRTVGRLSTVHIGPRLRERREATGVSLRRLARALDVSASFVSQLETGKARPSVATLYSICEALDLSIDDLFATESTSRQQASVTEARSMTGAANGPRDVASKARTRRPQGRSVPTSDVSRSPLVHPSERKVLVLDSGVTWERLTPTTGAKSNFLFIRYDVGAQSTSDGDLLRHVGSEYWFVLRGVLEVTLGLETYRVNAGDAITFDSSTPHRVTNPGGEPADAIRFDQSHDRPT
ncbi:MAG: helix-turn-helix domain-containing protein [Acidimicrobiales bacterium]